MWSRGGKTRACAGRGGPLGQVPHRTTREELPVCPITALQAPRGKAPPTWQGTAVAQGTPWSPATRDPLSVGADLPPLPTRPSRAVEHGWQAAACPLTMDQDYERRSCGRSSSRTRNGDAVRGSAGPCQRHPARWSLCRGWWGPRCAQPLGFVPWRTGAQQVTHASPWRHVPPGVTPSTSPHSSAAGATDPLILWVTGTDEWGELLLFPKLLPSAIL